MKPLLCRALAAGALLAAFTDPLAAAIDPVTLIKLSSSVLQIEVIRTQGGYSLGSGVVVGPDRVATNCHVTRDAQQVAVLQGGLRLPAQAQRVDADHDLCVLRVDGVEAGRAATLGKAAPLAIGQPLTAIGHTAGAMQNSPGEVLALHRLDGSAIIQTSNYFNSGASGGGLFDADSRLVGILTFRLRGGLAHYFAIPVEWLEDDLQDADAREQPVGPLPASARAFWERPKDLQPFFLRAAVFEATSDWKALQALAAEWIPEDADDPEPWYLLGLALGRQGLPAEARRALGCSLLLAPRSASARAELERLAAIGEPTPVDASASTGVRATVPAGAGSAGSAGNAGSTGTAGSTADADSTALSAGPGRAQGTASATNPAPSCRG